jgi:putative ABC transport system permease protein
MNSLVQDLRYALRQLRKSPGFTAVAVLTLALGIGVSTAMFGVMNAVLLQPPRFRDPDRIVRILSTQGDTVGGPSPLDVRDFAAQSHTFEKMAVYDSGWRKNVSALPGSTEPEQLPIGLMPAAYFEVLGVTPLMGRLFTEDENRWGNHYEVILSYGFWQARFQGDPAVLGKSIRINDEPYTIIAVMPAGLPEWFFDSLRGPVELWTPFVPYLAANETSVWDETARRSHAWAIGRLKPGVSLEEAQADLQRIAANLAASHPLDRGVSVALRPLQEDRVGTLRPVVLLLMGAVILILLIACSNVANLLLARNSSRAREVAVRVAMGAARSVLVRQFMTESLVLGVLSGALGCVLAWSSCAVVARAHPAQLVQLAGVRVDLRVLAFGLAVSVGSSLIFGVIPAWVSSGVNLSEAFKENGRAVAGRSKRWLRHSFVAGEMALAVMLLVGTGLLIQSLLRLQNQDPGFRVDHLLRTHLFLPPVRYSNPEIITHFCQEYAARVSQLPGVQDVTISAAYPPDDQWMQYFTIEGRPASRLEDTPEATFNVTDAHYVSTLGMPLLRGRNFSDLDTESSPPVALINKSLADRYFPGEDPVGKQIRMGLPPVGGASNLPPATVAADAPAILFTIVGVTGDSLNRGLALAPQPQLTALFRQTPNFNFGFKNLIVRTALDPLQVAAPIRRQLHSLDANVPFAEVYSMDQIMQQHTADRRYTTGLLALFAFFGVALAGIGVYGVVSYVVSQRTSEIGVRMALGAQHADVLWMVIRQGIGMAMAGAVAGLLGAWVLRRVMAQLVFGISPADPATFLAAALVLITFAASATYLPARRAAKVDPMVALRYE